MVEWRRDAEGSSEHAPGTKQGEVSEGNFMQVEGDRVEVAMNDSEGENDTDIDCDDDYDDDDDDSDLKTDSACAGNAIQLAAQKSSESRPSFGNIVVNSSSDVHFGNKTFYNGPVTIKQFVYTTRNGSADVHDDETGDNDGESRVGVDEVLEPVSGGLSNGKAKDLTTPNSENVAKVPSGHTGINEPSPDTKGSLLPTWQPTRSEYHFSKYTTWSNRMCVHRRESFAHLIPNYALASLNIEFVLMCSCFRYKSCYRKANHPSSVS
jgi:hypothetical protein